MTPSPKLMQTALRVGIAVLIAVELRDAIAALRRRAVAVATTWGRELERRERRNAHRAEMAALVTRIDRRRRA